MCGAMCRNPERTQRWLTKMREEMVSHFKLLVDASGGAKATMRSEHVVLVQAGVDGGGDSARFLTIAACLAHSGPHPAAQVFVESSLVEQSVTLDPNAPSEHVAGVLAGSRLVLTEGPSRQMSPSRRLPPVFEASTRAPPLCLYTCDELVADILNAAPTTVLVQVVLAQPTERLDTLEITGANDHRFIVSRGKPAILLPMRRSMPTSRDDIDLFEAIRPQRPHSVANELVAEVVHNPIGDGNLGDGGFKSLGDMIRDMFGLPSGDPLVAELGECEAELSRHSPLEEEAAPAEDEDGGDKEDSATEANDGLPASVQTLDDVMVRLGVVLEGRSYFVTQSASSSGPSPKRRIGVVNTMRRQGVDYTLQAMCACHSKCRLVVDIHRCSTRLELETLLLEWLANGANESSDAHHARSIAIRKGLGVKVRS